MGRKLSFTGGAASGGGGGGGGVPSDWLFIDTNTDRIDSKTLPFTNGVSRTWNDMLQKNNESGMCMSGGPYNAGNQIWYEQIPWSVSANGAITLGSKGRTQNSSNTSWSTTMHGSCDSADNPGSGNQAQWGSVGRQHWNSSYYIIGWGGRVYGSGATLNAGLDRNPYSDYSNSYPHPSSGRCVIMDSYMWYPGYNTSGHGRHGRINWSGDGYVSSFNNYSKNTYSSTGGGVQPLYHYTHHTHGQEGWLSDHRSPSSGFYCEIVYGGNYADQGYMNSQWGYDTTVSGMDCWHMDANKNIYQMGTKCKVTNNSGSVTTAHSVTYFPQWSQGTSNNRTNFACGSDFFYNKADSDYGVFHKITLDGSNVPTYAPKCKMITAFGSGPRSAGSAYMRLVQDWNVLIVSKPNENWIETYDATKIKELLV
jgi:hypothetical protein